MKMQDELGKIDINIPSHFQPRIHILVCGYAITEIG